MRIWNMTGFGSPTRLVIADVAWLAQSLGGYPSLSHKCRLPSSRDCANSILNYIEKKVTMYSRVVK